MTSAVMRMPRAFAHRTTSTLPAVETWQTWRREPVDSASSASRAMIASSATAGQPFRPRSAATAPSCSCAPAVSRGSSACCAITPSTIRAYSSARRISSGSATHEPSSLKIRTRARERAIATSSASSLPSRPFETAPIGRTST